MPEDPPHALPSEDSSPLNDLLDYPLVRAIFGRRSRRFGLGMEIPSGPLAFRSEADPLPLSELERSLLVAVGTGVSGWNFGVPHGPARPDGHADYTLRYTGRTAPTAAGIGTPVLFFTDDDGTSITNTRDLEPTHVREPTEDVEEVEQIVARCRECTRKLSDARLDLPRAPGHMLEPNLWWANRPGSTLFMPVGDASEELLGILCILVENGYLIVDPEAGAPAGDLAPFIRSGLLDDGKRFPLPFLESIAQQAICAEASFMAHNMVLAMQAMGLGGLYFSGLNELSVMGASLDDEGPDLEGLGIRFQEREEWIVPNPVGLDGIYEGLCPPYHEDMRAAVETFVERKFGSGGAYDQRTPGPWKDTMGVKGSVRPYDDEMIDCLAEIAGYVHDKHGKFPGTVPTLMLPGFVQAHHLDTAYYDENFQPGAYLETHATHLDRWHPGA